MFDERFARQYRFDLPPRFPLASVYTSKVHHLSGPIDNALTHTAHKRSPTADAAACAWHPVLTFISRISLSLAHSH